MSFTVNSWILKSSIGIGVGTYEPLNPRVPTSVTHSVYDDARMTVYADTIWKWIDAALNATCWERVDANGNVVELQARPDPSHPFGQAVVMSVPPPDTVWKKDDGCLSQDQCDNSGSSGDGTGGTGGGGGGGSYEWVTCVYFYSYTDSFGNDIYALGYCYYH